MIRRLITAAAAAISLSACAGPMVDHAASRLEGLVIVSLTADAPTHAHIAQLTYRVRPVEPVGEGEQVAQARRRSSSVNEQFRRAATENARRAADNTRSRLTVLGSDVPDAERIQVADKTIGRVLVLRLPPGEYELRDWSLSMRDPNGKVELSAPDGDAYRFAVVGGTQRYVGNVHLSLKPGSRFTQTLSAARERDLGMAGAFDPALKADTVVDAPAQRMR